MNPTASYSLTDEQKERYQIQPDKINDPNSAYDGDHELLYYIKGTSMRFWYNTQYDSYPTHWHSAIEIIVPIEENYTVVVQQQEYVLMPGDILMIPAGHLHSLISPPKGSRLILIFEIDPFAKLEGFTYVLSLMNKPIHLTNELYPNIYETEMKIILEIADHYWSNSIIKELYIHSNLLQFFAVFAECSLQKETSSSTASSANALSTKLNSVFEYLEQHYSENLSLEDIASMAGFSKYHFSRMFKECTNQTFYEYLSCKRIQAAEQLLIIPNLSITEIAHQSGFYSLSSFNRTFKRLKGCTPSEYRSLYSSRKLDFFLQPKQ